MSTTASVLRNTYPKNMLGRGLAINAFCIGVGTAIAPSLGAGLLALGNWRWLFGVSVPVGLAIFLLLRALPDTPRSARVIDPLNALLNAGLFCLGIGGLQQVVASPLLGIAMLAGSAVCLTLLMRRERGLPAPMLPVDLLSFPLFRFAVLTSVCSFSAQMMCFIALPFYLQHQLGLTATHTGLLMIAWPLAVACAAQAVGRLADRYPPQSLCLIGGLAMAFGLMGAALWPVQESQWPLVAFLLIGGTGFGFFQVPNNRVLLTSTPATRAGATGGAQATARQTGMALGAAGVAILLHLLPDNGSRLGLAVAAVLALLSAVTNLRANKTRRQIAQGSSSSP